MEQAFPLQVVQERTHTHRVGRTMTVAATVVLIVALAAATALQAVDRSHLHGRVAALSGQLATAQSNLASANGQIASLQGQVSDLQSQIASLQQSVGACQRAAGSIAQAWSLTDKARVWTGRAVMAAAVGYYSVAVYDLQRARGLTRQANGVVGSSRSDIRVCAGSGSSNSGV